MSNSVAANARSLPRPLAGALALTLAATATGCIPYTVGSTAETVPVGVATRATSWYFIPNAVEGPGDTAAAPIRGVDFEMRFGRTARSDIGLRLPPGGAVVNYKRRFADAAAGRPAMAYIVGGGIVNAGEHAHVEATLVTSSDPRSSLRLYGGLRAMQVVPITSGAVQDSPTAGVFGGLELGDVLPGGSGSSSMTLRPELGIYYDRSALGLRRSSIIFVPAVTLQRGRR